VVDSEDLKPAAQNLSALLWAGWIHILQRLGPCCKVRTTERPTGSRSPVHWQIWRSSPAGNFKLTVTFHWPFARSTEVHLVKTHSAVRSWETQAWIHPARANG